MSEQKQVQFAKVGENDQMPYVKIDISKSCRVGGNFAISFYQIDYQALALALNNQSSLKPGENMLIPVSKIVMDFTVFNQLREELNKLHEMFEKENIKGDQKVDIK